MRVLHFDDSYNIWSPSKMRQMMEDQCGCKNVSNYLNRSVPGLVVEWWIHNIGYYATKPFPALDYYNKRFKDVDLEEKIS